MRAGKLRSSRITTLLASVLVAGGLLLPAAVTAQSVYTIDDLGVLPGDTSSVSQGINELGDVVGWSNGPGGAPPTRAVRRPIPTMRAPQRPSTTTRRQRSLSSSL